MRVLKCHIYTFLAVVKGFYWQVRRHLFKSTWVVVTLVLLAIITYAVHDVGRSMRSVDVVLKANSNSNQQNLLVHADRWIVVDGTAIPSEDLLHVADVPGWRTLIFKEHLESFKDSRCSQCTFINGVTQMSLNSPSSSDMNIQMTSYLYAISHGAKWIYVTDQITGLKEQVEGFHFDEKITGLLYQGKMMFDPDRHFGVKDFTSDHVIRNKHVMYNHGDYLTPSIQSKWRPPEHFIGTDHFDIENIACRLPYAIVPPHLFPATYLTGSLVEYKSFWTLGSLLSEPKSTSLAYWWLWLMRDANITIGKYPPSCERVTYFSDSEELIINQDVKAVLVKLTCNRHDNFFTCAIHLAEAMKQLDLLTQTELDLLKKWFNALNSLNFKEPVRGHAVNVTYALGEVHKVVLELSAKTHSKHEIFENPFHKICKSTLPVPKTNSAPPIRDILLVVVFNFSSYYTNIMYLNYIYRKFFTNILYCGMQMGNFGLFQRQYLRPINFIEINEMDRGIHAYMCAAYAMEMGFKVSGYLQISDDVLLNMWNVVDLPRDKLWFQNNFKKGKLQANKVPNIIPVMEEWYYWPWSSKRWGVRRLRQMWSLFNQLQQTSERFRVANFLNHLETNFGGDESGAFYEVSDIFYVPDHHKNNFIYFSKLSFNHSLFLEIAIPTMLCGFDSLDNIHRLNGTYLLKNRSNYYGFYNPQNIFLHPWKLKKMIVNREDRVFICSKYLPFIEGMGSLTST